MPHYLNMQNDHITDDQLECYYLDQLAETAKADLELHLLACPRCVARAEGIEAFIDSLRLALIRNGDDVTFAPKVT